MDHGTEILYGGTGIGLSISKAIIEKLGGRIWLASKKTKGSEFRFTIPAFKQKELFKINSSDNINEVKLDLVGKTILIAEDEKYNHELLDIILTNAGAKPGDKLILTKPLGTGAIISAKKIDLAEEETYNKAIETMKLLNDEGAEIMNKYSVKCATDITGFGLIGHSLKMAQGSNVSIHINAANVPAIDKVMDLIDMGCIPGAAFRNLEFTKDDCRFDESVDYNSKMLLLDAQTSGGLLICAPSNRADKIAEELRNSKYPETAIIGEVLEKSEKPVYVI